MRMRVIPLVRRRCAAVWQRTGVTLMGQTRSARRQTRYPRWGSAREPHTVSGPWILTSEPLRKGRITRDLLVHEPGLDLVRAQNSVLIGIDDPSVLAWAAVNGRVVLSHDRNTMTDAAILRINAGDATLDW